MTAETTLDDIRAQAAANRRAALVAAQHGMRMAAIRFVRKAQECDEAAQEWQSFLLGLKRPG